jgi:hypothetical protein
MLTSYLRISNFASDKPIYGLFETVTRTEAAELCLQRQVRRMKMGVNYYLHRMKVRGKIDFCKSLL